MRKLSVIDTGIGMRPPMRCTTTSTTLAATSHEQGRTKNYGVGAKVAAGSRNPHGARIPLLASGQGSALVCFKRHHDGRWGLQPQQWPDGRSDFWRPLSEQREAVGCCAAGRTARRWCCSASTSVKTPTQAPKSVTEGRQRWITRFT